MIDTISGSLAVSPLSEDVLRGLETDLKSIEHSILDTSTFSQPWFDAIRTENGKKSDLINKWNGSEEQRAFLRKTLKNRKVTWGDKITKTKSHGIYKIIMDTNEYYTPSLNKFAKQYKLNAASLRQSLWNNRIVNTKGHQVSVTLQ